MCVGIIYFTYILDQKSIVLELPDDMVMPDGTKNVNLENETQMNWLKVQLQLCTFEKDYTQYEGDKWLYLTNNT